MSVLHDETATAPVKMRKAVEYIIRFAKDRRKSRESNADASIYWGNALGLFISTFDQIEKSREVIATSKALLQKINERRQKGQFLA